MTNKYTEKIQNDEIIKLIMPYIKHEQVYLVGGYIRDLFMDKQSPDRDLIICTEDIELFAKNLADNLEAHFIELDRINRIYRVVLPDKVNYIDITAPIENDLQKDILRRDFTMNSIAFSLNYNKFIDITGGLNDIKNKKIKGIADTNFEDDPLRLLRIFRFHAATGFDIDEHLITLAKKLNTSINEPAKERINVELLKMFEGQYTVSALQKLDESGILDELFPIYKEVKKIPPNSHHHLDLFHHLVETVNQIQIYYNQAPEIIKKYLDDKAVGGVKRLAFLKLAGFLHDIGKPSCWTIEEDTGRHRFIKHDEIGSKLVVPILKNLKFSKKQIEYISTLIKYHIYPSSLVSASDVNDKAFLKFYRKMDGFVLDVIILAMADRLSAKGEKVTAEMVEHNINGLKKLADDYLMMQNDIKPLEKLLDGIDVMEILNIPQGPKIGEILEALQEAQLNGLIRTKEDAVIFIKLYKV